MALTTSSRIKTHVNSIPVNGLALMPLTTITTALTNSIANVTWTDYEGNSQTTAYYAFEHAPSAANFDIQFTYGSSGTTLHAYIQTSLDEGLTWIDIRCFSVTTSSLTNVVNHSAYTAVTTAVVPTDGSLTANTSVDGVLGRAFRVKVTSTGTYATSTTLAVFMTTQF